MNMIVCHGCGCDSLVCDSLVHGGHPVLVVKLHVCRLFAKNLVQLTSPTLFLYRLACRDHAHGHDLYHGNYQLA